MGIRARSGQDQGTSSARHTATVSSFTQSSHHQWVRVRQGWLLLLVWSRCGCLLGEGWNPLAIRHSRRCKGVGVGGGTVGRANPSSGNVALTHHEARDVRACLALPIGRAGQ